MSDMAKVPFGRLISVATAAKRLGKSRVQIWNYIKSGRLPACPVDGGKAFVIDAAELERFEPPPKGNPNFSRKRS